MEPEVDKDVMMYLRSVVWLWVALASHPARPLHV